MDGHYVLEALQKRKGRVLVTLTGLALIFSAFAMVQHWFVHRQVYQTASQELSSWAEEIGNEVAYTAKWDLKGYRQAAYGKSVVAYLPQVRSRRRPNF